LRTGDRRLGGLRRRTFGAALQLHEIALIAALVCCTVGWLVTVQSSTALSSGQVLRWLAVTLAATALSLFAPLLIGYGLVRGQPRTTAVPLSLPLGLLGSGLFAVLHTAFACFIAFSC
jgi:hypothetical protein